MENINWELVNWSRAQFALTAIYHWLFVPLTLGLSFIIAMMESIYVKTKNPEWKRITKLWMTLFGINFAIGGIFLSLAILYFLLHLFYSNRKENLYYSLFSFSLSLLFFASMLESFVFKELIWIIIFKLIGITGIALAFLGYLGFIYSIFYQKMPKQIWLFVF